MLGVEAWKRLELLIESRCCAPWAGVVAKQVQVHDPSTVEVNLESFQKKLIESY